MQLDLPDSRASLFSANFLEIEVTRPSTHGFGNKRYTDYEVRMRTNLPVFKLKEFKCRRRYSDFDWLKGRFHLRFWGPFISSAMQKCGRGVRFRVRDCSNLARQAYRSNQSFTRDPAGQQIGGVRNHRRKNVLACLYPNRKLENERKKRKCSFGPLDRDQENGPDQRAGVARQGRAAVF